MKYTSSFFTLLVLCIVFLPGVMAQTYHTTLLTVGENGESFVGGTADLFLEIKPGTGRVFIDTYPITKTDTQFSTRYAKEIACDFLQRSCQNIDFFYTIRSGSTIVGGPSAGGAIAILTIAALEGEDINQDVAMTGTINSGALIGSVAGIIPKIEAAKARGFTTVIIPKLSALGLEVDIPNGTNISDINLSVSYDQKILDQVNDESFSVIQAADLYEALPYFINKAYPEPSNNLTVPESYNDIMHAVAKLLCERREAFIEQNTDYLTNSTLQNASQQVAQQVQDAVEQERFYAAASFCFTQNIRLQQARLNDMRQGALRKVYEHTGQALTELEIVLLNEPLTTISDVETLAIVRERFVEAKNLMQEINVTNISSIELGYTVERAYSATVWAEFFAMESREYTVNKALLEQACTRKFSEAEERITYAESFLPKEYVARAREALERARVDQTSEEYALCLFSAGKAKAEANMLTASLSVTQTHLNVIVEQRLRAVERALARQTSNDLFPIMGYSYFQYAQSLADTQQMSALTFSEYALELSNLGMYFPKDEREVQTPILIEITNTQVAIFIAGFLSGIFVLWLVRVSGRQRK